MLTAFASAADAGNGVSTARHDHGRWVVLCCLALVALAFAPTLGFDFVNWDDDLHVYRNPDVIGSPSVTDLLLTPRLGYAIPVTLASYRLEHALFGLDPSWFHATNVALHLASCWLLFGLARRLGVSVRAAAVATLIFGLHPAAAEPVSWISGRKDLLAACFGLWALLEHTAHPFEWRRPRTYLSPLLFGVAALAKPVVLLLPAVMAVWHIAQRREGVVRAVVSVAPAMVLALVVLALALVGQGQAGAIYEPPSLATWLRNLWYALGYHLGLASFVHAPAPKHLVAAMPPGFDPLVDLFPLVWIGGLAALSWRLPAQRRLVLCGLAFALAVYIPSSNAVPLMRFLADSYVYLPLAGIGLILAAVVQYAEGRARSRSARFALSGAVCALALLLFTSTIAASSTWRNGVALWGGLSERYPSSPQVCRQYGNALNEAGQNEQALAHYMACARALGPKHFRKNIAITLFLLGRYDEARDDLERLARERPGDATIRRYLQEVRALAPPTDAAGGMPR